MHQSSAPTILAEQRRVESVLFGIKFLIRVYHILVGVVGRYRHVKDCTEAPWTDK